jgi:hypothetical protein
MTSRGNNALEWSVMNLRPGWYEAVVEEPGGARYAMGFSIPREGQVDVRINLPPLSVVDVSTVDARSMESIEVHELVATPCDVTPGQSHPMVEKVGGDSFVVRLFASSVTLSCAEYDIVKTRVGDSGEWNTSEPGEIALTTYQECTLAVERLVPHGDNSAFVEIVIIDEHGRAVAFADEFWNAVVIENVSDGGEYCFWRHSRNGRTVLALSQSGTYRVAMPHIKGYADVPVAIVDVDEGQTEEVRIDLVPTTE